MISFVKLGVRWSGRLVMEKGRAASFVWFAGGALLLGYVVVLAPINGRLESESLREPGLKAQFEEKLVLASALKAWHDRKATLASELVNLEKSLAGHPSLPFDNLMQMARGHGIQVMSLEREGVPRQGEAYVDEFARVRMSGSFVAFARFVDDLANMRSANTTLRDMRWVAGAGQTVELEAMVQAYRPLSPQELAAKLARGGKTSPPKGAR